MLLTIVKCLISGYDWAVMATKTVREDNGIGAAQARPLAEICPKFHKTIELVGKRWTGAIVQLLMAGPQRFTALRGAVPGLHDRLLSERLQARDAIDTDAAAPSAGKTARQPGQAARHAPPAGPAQAAGGRRQPAAQDGDQRDDPAPG